jgi:hypothetical protein
MPERELSPGIKERYYDEPRIIFFQELIWQNESVSATKSFLAPHSGKYLCTFSGTAWSNLTTAATILNLTFGTYTCSLSVGSVSVANAHFPMGSRQFLAEFVKDISYTASLALGNTNSKFDVNSRAYIGILYLGV